MRFEESKKINGLVVIHPNVFYDHRGENVQTFSSIEMLEMLNKLNLPKLTFNVDSFSFSKKDVLRGFHGDAKAWKLVQCIQGSIQLVVIDLREGETKDKVETFYLNERNRTQILIPSGCVNAHLCLSETCIFSYKLSDTYVPIEQQLHVKWNDPKYNVFWPVKEPIVSKRDS